MFVVKRNKFLFEVLLLLIQKMLGSIFTNLGAQQIQGLTNKFQTPYQKYRILYESRLQMIK